MSQTPLDVERATPSDDSPRSSGRRPRRALVVLPLVVVLFVIWSSGPPDLPLGDAVNDAITLTISVIIESMPFVVLGIGLSVVVQVWMPQRLLITLLPTNPFLRRALLSLLGVLLPVCECGNVPLARGLMARGLSVAEAMTFLLAAPILNPVTIVVTYQAFGFSDGILAWRVIGGFVIANFVGWLFSRHPQPDRLLTPRFTAACRTDHHAPSSTAVLRALHMFVTEASAVLPALFVGAAAAGLIQVAVSRDVLLALGQNPIWSVLALMGLASVIAICSTVDAFFILSFGSTFTPGAIVAFLVLGPMIDIKMLALLRTTFTTATLAALTGVVVLATAALGLAVNLAH